jgi:diguanylate cyclase (GGDEF)-like protein
MAESQSGDEVIVQLKERIDHLEKENRKWMRLAGINRLTELPNNLMLYQVVLPQELRKGINNPLNLACILICPDGLGEINQRHGRIIGDGLIKEIGLFFKERTEAEEQLYHTDGANFVLLMPGANEGKAKRKATQIKDEFKEARHNTRQN